MGDNKNESLKSRRWFLSLLTGTDTKPAQAGKVKMLTAEGKLVEIDKAALDAASTKQKASNKEIYDWMKNPSKENNS